MIGIILELMLKLGIVLVIGFLLQKFGVFAFLGKSFSFLNVETKKYYQNQERTRKLKAQLKRSIKRCDEL